MILPIDTHVADARSRLLMQYKDRPNLSALIDALLSPVQEIEDVVSSMYGRLDIEGSAGEQLNGIGRIVGTERAGWEDAVYRVLLTARCAQLVSRGTIEEIIGVWKILSQADNIHVLEVYPGQVDLYCDVPLDEDLIQFIFTMMRKVPAGGVEIDFPAIIYTASNDFGFDPDDDTVGGFGDVDDPDAGGQLAYIQGAELSHAGPSGTAYVEAGGDYYILPNGEYYIVKE